MTFFLLALLSSWVINFLFSLSIHKYYNSVEFGRITRTEKTLTHTWMKFWMTDRKGPQSRSNRSQEKDPEMSVVVGNMLYKRILYTINSIGGWMFKTKVSGSHLFSQISRFPLWLAGDDNLILRWSFMHVLTLPISSAKNTSGT